MTTSAPMRTPTPVDTVGGLMRPGIVTCARTATAGEVARIMDATGTDCVVILSNGHDESQFPTVWGMVTREDLARPLGQANPLATAEELARTPIVRTHADLKIADARSLCSAMGVSYLLVVDPTHATPLAVVSETDLRFPNPSPRLTTKENPS
jgi:predicted transcriptional regulator